MNFAAGLFGLDGQGWLSLGLGSLFTLVVALLVYFRQKSTKTLDYGSYELQPLGADDDVYPGIKLAVTWAPPEGSNLTWEPELLTEAQVGHYRIKNTGKRAIQDVDFQQPITVTAPGGRLIDCVVTEVSRPGVCELGSVYVPRDGPRLGNELAFTPSLLNPSDWVEISVLTDGLDGEVLISSWLIEESRPMRKRARILLPPLREVVALSVREEPLSLRRTLLLLAVALAIYALYVVIIG